MLVLGIESSCDETAAAVVKNGREILSNVISSQIALHTLYGGVVPEIASRKHIEKINQVIEEALEQAEVTLDDLDAATRAYADGKLSLVKLWENASPTSTFYAQTVSLDLSGYDFVSVYYKNIPSGAAYFSSGIVPIGDRITMQYVSTSGSMYHRHGDVSESGISFSAGQLNGEASNSAPVPLSIYGWKGVTA